MGAKMSNENKAVFGIFKRPDQIDVAKTQLGKLGFSRSDIATMQPRYNGSKDFSQHPGTMLRPFALIGAIIGSFIFVTVGVVFSLKMTPVSFLQGESSTTAQLITVVACLFGGILAGSAIGALVGIGTPRRAGQRYGNYVGFGGTLMSVHVKNELDVDRATAELKNAGAQDISVLDEKEGWESARAKAIQPDATV